MNTSGPCPADIMLIGEAWGKHEEADPSHPPFIGPSGWELDRMLAEAGLRRSQCFCANVVNHRPVGDKIQTLFLNKTQAKKLGAPSVLGRYPSPIVLDGMAALREAILRCRPKLIIPLGGTALWFLTGHEGITKWRGSELGPEEITNEAYPGPKETCVVPTVHPATVLREWPWRPIVTQDFRRAKRVLERGIKKPAWQFSVGPSFAQATALIHSAVEHRRRGGAIVCDTETRGGQLSCVGIATSKCEAFCIPFLSINRPEGYWSTSEEIEIVYALKALLAWRGPPIIFQNFMYDGQYFAKQLGWLPATTDDTMLMQHIAFPSLRKGLDFISSMYCEYHRYWKDDGKLWDPRIHPEWQHWNYNCEDCVRTFEGFEELTTILKGMNLEAQYRRRMRVLHVMLKAALRGITVDVAFKMAMQKSLVASMGECESWINRALGREFNCRSHPQMVDLFYNEMGCPPIKHRGQNGEWTVTCDDGALIKIKSKYPLLRPLVERIEEFRSYGVFHKNYSQMLVPPDGRLRPGTNVCGASTFRFSVTEDAFGYGGNLQTIPKGTED